MYKRYVPTLLTAAVVLALIAGMGRAVTHERNLIWAQKDARSNVARLVGVTGDPHSWVVNRTATTKYITAPNKHWRFSGLAFDFQRQTLYWSDTGNKKIQGLQLNGSHAAFTIFGGTSSVVEGLTVDWTAGNVYWTDALYNWIVVAPAHRESALFAVIVKTGLDRPNGIAVSPQKGLLFWSDWGTMPKIERSTCAGEGRRILVKKDLIRPLGMVLDHKHSLLYWVDGSKGTVESIDVYGNNRQQRFHVDGARFYGITLYKNYIFATEQKDLQLYVFDAESERHEVKFSTGARPYDVLMYDDGIQAKVQDPCLGVGCDHICISAGGARAQCLCAMGFTLQSDERTCSDDGRFGTPQYIYSIGTALCRFPGNMADMSLTNVSLDTQCFLTHRRDALALAAHVHQDAVYVAENKTRTISRLKMVAGAGPEVIVGGTGSVEGLALDWVASNLYWTDSVFQQIMVSRADGRFQAPLLTSQLNRPRGIAVDPVNSNIYWTDVGPEARIERARLDGSERTVFISTELGSPNHIVIDLRTSTICWSDSVMDRLECVGLDGHNRRVVFSQPDTDMYGITIFQDFIIWTDRGKRNGIHAGIRDTGEKVRGIIHPGIGRSYDVITYDASLQPLVEGACSDNNGGCEHLCLATPSGGPRNYKCKCAMGFMLAADGRSCAADAFYDNFMLFTDTYQKQIYQMSLSSDSFHAVPLTGHDNPIAVDYDPVGRRVYWTDVADKVIKCAFVNGTDEVVVRQLDEKSIPDGLALEPSSRLAYYTDTGLKVIGAVTLETGHHRVIIDDFLDQPRAIVLDPGRGHMYWTDWGLHSRIEKASMDGSARRRVVNTGLGAWPNGLAIDTEEERLYWCDARSDQIESSDLDGMNRRAIYRDEESHFFGLAAIDGIIYYTDWTKKSIMKLERSGEQFISSPLGSATFARLNDIHVYRQNSVDARYLENACGYRNGGCSHLCLPVPSGRTCACPKGMQLVSGYRCVIGTDEEVTTTKAVAVPTRVTQLVPHVRVSPRTSPGWAPHDVTTGRHVGDPQGPSPDNGSGKGGTAAIRLTTFRTSLSPSSSTERTTTAATRRRTTRTVLPPTVTPRTKPTLTTTTSPTTSSQQTTTTTVTSPTTTTTTTTTTRSTAPTTTRKFTHTPHTTTKQTFTPVWLSNSSKKSAISRPTPSTTVEPTRRTSRKQRPTHSGDVTDSWAAGVTKPRLTPATSSRLTNRRTPHISSTTVTPRPSVSDLVNSTVDQSVLNSTSQVPRQLNPSDRLDDFEFSMFALLAIIVGGIVLMCLIIVSGVMLYRKMDPGSPRRRRMASVEPALSSLSDIYEMPTKEHGHFSERPASRYGFLHDRYYNGDLDSGLDNPGFSRRDSVNTYEEIFDAVEEDRSHPTFSTFR